MHLFNTQRRALRTQPTLHTFASLFLCGVALSACPAAPESPDAGTADARSDAAGATDSVAADSIVSDSTTPQDSFVADNGGPATTAAVPGARCALTERIGLVQIINEFGMLQAYGQVFNKPNPLYGDYTLEDDNCGFHEATSPIDCSEPCQQGQICGSLGECTSPAVADLGAHMRLSAAGQQQDFETDSTYEAMIGEVTLPGNSFAIELQWANQTVTLAATDVPAELNNIVAYLEGDSSAPEGLDLTWDVPASGGMAYTNIPVNHHVGGLTFTECAIAASTGSLQVSGNMLQPLALITGLEFQSVEHLRFAAAQTPLGCVELRLGSSTMVSP